MKTGKSASVPTEPCAGGCGAHAAGLGKGWMCGPCCEGARTLNANAIRLAKEPKKHPRIVKKRIAVWAPHAPEEKGQPDEYRRWREVALCTCCAHHGSFECPDLIEHDALCIVRIEEEGARWHGEIQCRDSRDTVEQKVMRALFKRAGALMGLDNEAVKHALTALYAWVPEQHSVRGAKGAPLLSEAYLYPLLGKEDARTLLALVGAIARAVGYERPLGQ